MDTACERLPYPPVPPNCPFFSKMCPGVFSLHVTGGMQIERDCGLPMDVYERVIVASVSRHAWQDLADVVLKRIESSGNDDPSYERTGSAWDEIEEYDANVEAWKLWITQL